MVSDPNNSKLHVTSSTFYLLENDYVRLSALALYLHTNMCLPDFIKEV